MEFKKFKEIIELHKDGSNMIHELYQIGFDLMEGKYKLSEILDKQFDINISNEYSESGIDWINWFIYESDYGNKDWSKIPTYTKNNDGTHIKENKRSKYGAHDENGKPICFDIKSLWNHLEKEHKLCKHIGNSIKRAFNAAKRKQWDKLYVAIDIHDTFIHGNYLVGDIPKEFISISKEVLQYLSNRKDIILLLYTCSHPTEIIKYLEYFKENKINFKYANENPEVPNNALGCYDTKMYFNLLFEDKSGFDGETDWYIIYEEFKKYEEL